MMDVSSAQNFGEDALNFLIYELLYTMLNTCTYSNLVYTRV